MSVFVAVFWAQLLGLPWFPKHRRPEVKVILLLWLKAENVKSFTGNLGPSFMSTGCPIHVLSTLPLLYCHFRSSVPTGLLRAEMVSCLDYDKSSEFRVSELVPVSLFPQASDGFHGKARKPEILEPHFKTAHALNLSQLSLPRPQSWSQ